MDGRDQQQREIPDGLDFSEDELRVFLPGRTTFSPKSIEILIDVARRRCVSSGDAG
jgi:hypothetical protein